MRRVLVMKGVGLGWRPETAWLVAERAAFTEVIAESIDPAKPPRALVHATMPVIAHGVTLSIGSSQRPDRARVDRLARVAHALRSPLVSEHVAFSRAGGIESPHFLPVPHTRAQLAVLVDNVQRVMDALPVPLALENIAAPVRWPGDELAEAEFLAELLARTGALLLLDVSNLYANLVNHGGDLDAYLDRLPLDRIAYMHVAGGARVDKLWRDTHAHPIAQPIVDTLDRVLARTGPRPILLERDHHYGTREGLEGELACIATSLGRAQPVTHVQRHETVTLPRIDRALRMRLDAEHARLFRGDAAFDQIQLAELRSIVGGKRSTMRAPWPSSTTS